MQQLIVSLQILKLSAMYVTKLTMCSFHWQFHHTEIPSPASVFHRKSLDGSVCTLHTERHTNMKHKASGALHLQRFHCGNRVWRSGVCKPVASNIYDYSCR